MANDFWSEFNTQDLQLRQPESVNLSALGQTYGREYGQLEQAEDLQRQAEMEETKRALASQQEQYLTNQSSRGLGEGAYAQYERLPMETEAAQVMSDAEMKKLYEGEIKRSMRTESLRRDIANRQMSEIGRDFSSQMQNWTRKYQQLQQDVSAKMVDEQRESEYQLQLDYDRSVRELNKSLLGREKRRAILGGLGQIAGGVAGFAFGGGLPGAVAGSRIGGSVGSGLGNLLGGNRYYRDLQRSIYV